MADQAPASVFEDQKQTIAPAGDTSIDEQVAILVGPDRKYKTVGELAKAYIHVDGFTETLKAENQELREKLAGSKTVEDVLERLKQSKAPATDKGEDKGAGLSAEAVADIVRKTVTGLETGKVKAGNLARADAEMKKLFGEKAGDVFAAAAATPEAKRALTELASVSPEQFIKLFKQPTAKQEQGQTEGGSSINSAALEDVNQSGRTTDPGTKEYYNALRQKEPKKYYSADVQLAMNKAAVANPEKFFGRKAA